MSGFTVDPDGTLPDALRGEVAESIWTGRPAHDTFTVGEPPHTWVIAGCQVPEAVYRRHAELVGRLEPLMDQLEQVDGALRVVGIDARPRWEALAEMASHVAEAERLRAVAEAAEAYFADPSPMRCRPVLDALAAWKGSK